MLYQFVALDGHPSKIGTLGCIVRVKQFDAIGTDKSGVVAVAKVLAIVVHMPREGVFAKVTKGGVIRKGDQVSFKLPVR